MDFNRKRKFILMVTFVIVLIAVALGLAFCSRQGDEGKDPSGSSESSSDFAELLENEDLDKDNNVVDEYASEEDATPIPSVGGSSHKKDEKEDTGEKPSVDAGNNDSNSNSGNAGNSGNGEDSNTGGNGDSGNTGDDDEGGNTEGDQPDTNLKPSKDTEGDEYGPVTFY